MKKLLLAGGESLLRIGAVFAVVTLACVFAPSSHAQTPGQTYNLVFDGFPNGSIELSTYIGLDRKLKTNVPGHTLHIQAIPALTKAQRVRLSIAVSAQGSGVTECNRQIATAVTVPFDIVGAGRDLGASDFTGSSGIGVQTSNTDQTCIDALADKITQGVAAIPTGIYRLDVVVNDATTGAVLGSGNHTITILGASTTEATLSLSSPQNGEQVTQSASVVFNFENSISGRLLVFEHSSLTQSPDDATRDLNSPLKVVDVAFAQNQTGSNQVNAVSPGLATRPWTAGKKYSWYFLGSYASSTSVAAGTGEVKKSPVWSFTVVSSDPFYGRLVDALAGAPDPIGSTYQNLVNSGYTLNLTSPFYLQEGDNGAKQSIDLTQVLSFLRGLASRNVQFKAGIVTQ
ncbi:MAG: hypothetical protein NTU47_01645 [Ignavibacteriales bacterium]|nr:hypothetical protein [Ignavibacteriales bacterium]